MSRSIHSQGNTEYKELFTFIPHVCPPKKKQGSSKKRSRSTSVGSCCPIGGKGRRHTKFCRVARDAGYHWAWSDTCCIDQNNNVELGQSVKFHVHLVSLLSTHHCLPVGCSALVKVGSTRKQHLEHARMDRSGIPRS
ncbi:hypothetical protein BDR07DRAFT_1083856 [Suillus spraguei]|nr:hypothetical protein BDR07DRAFT_1083856 [Suillus spraguei]